MGSLAVWQLVALLAGKKTRAQQTIRVKTARSQREPITFRATPDLLENPAI